MRNRKKIAALFMSLLLALLCLAIVWLFTESFFFTSDRANNTAAIAIRDDVVPFQQFGTRLFTLPYLERAYSETVYFTEYGYDEKKDAFLGALNRLLATYPQVDIFILAHSNHYHEWVQQIDPALRKNIRMVYNTGCGDARLSDRWLGLGAKSYVAHTGGQSQSPFFYFFFLRRWCAGETVGAAVAQANENMTEKLDRLFADPSVAQGALAQCYGDSTYSIDAAK